MTPLARLRPTSLRRRVTLSGVAVVAALVLALDVLVYLSLRDLMLSNLEAVLDARQQLAQEVLDEPMGAQAAAERLDAAGLRAVVRTVSGDVLASPGAPAFDRVPPGGGSEAGYAWRQFELADGSDLFILASRGGIDATLERLLVLEVVGTIAVIALAYGLFDRTSSLVLRPVRVVARTARRIADGDIEERLPAREEDEELADMVTAFNGMLDALEQALARSRGSEETSRRFLADAAHQLRTPMAGIRATVGSLLRSDDLGERDRLLDSLAREVARASRLLSSLLRVARLDALEPPSFSPTPLEEVVRDVVARQRGLSPLLTLDVEAAGDLVAEVDGEAIHEAVTNLVDNAARHARHRVLVELRERGADVEIAVADDGPGLPPGAEEQVFDRFVTLGDAGGSGLGLPIARGIAEAHAGTLRYADGRFLLCLPRHARA